MASAFLAHAARRASAPPASRLGSRIRRCFAATADAPPPPADQSAAPPAEAAGHTGLPAQHSGAQPQRPLTQPQLSPAYNHYYQEWNSGDRKYPRDDQDWESDPRFQMHWGSQRDRAVGSQGDREEGSGALAPLAQGGSNAMQLRRPAIRGMQRRMKGELKRGVYAVKLSEDPETGKVKVHEFSGMFVSPAKDPGTFVINCMLVAITGKFH